MWDDFNTAVQSIDVAALDMAGLGGLAGRIGSARAVLDGLEARVAAAMRERGASEASTAETLRRRTGCSTREAKHRARRAETLQRMPNVSEALSTGRITGEHATALARAALETSPEAVDGNAGLLADAEAVPADLASVKARDWVRQHQTGDDLHRLHLWQRRNRSLNFTSGDGGMLTGIAKFDRLTGAQFQTLIEALGDRLYCEDGGRDNLHARSRTQCRHDALLALVGIEPPPPPGEPDTASGGSAANRPALGLRRPGLEPLPSNAKGRATKRGSSANGNAASHGARDGGRACDGGAGAGAAGVGAANAGSVDGTAGAGAANTGAGAANAGSVDGAAGAGAANAGSVDGTLGDRSADPAGPAVADDTCADSGSGAAPAWERPGGSVWPGCTCGPGLGGRGQLCVVMDLPYLATAGEQGRCEIPGVGPIARSEFERYSCDADLYGLMFDRNGVSLYHGRKTRRVSPQQWRVLLARDRGCVLCGAPPSWCQAHHIKHWSRGGRTDIDNLALVCHLHHRWLHDNSVMLKRWPRGWAIPTGLPPPRRDRAPTGVRRLKSVSSP